MVPAEALVKILSFDAFRKTDKSIPEDQVGTEMDVAGRPAQLFKLAEDFRFRPHAFIVGNGNRMQFSNPTPFADPLSIQKTYAYMSVSAKRRVSPRSGCLSFHPFWRVLDARKGTKSEISVRANQRRQRQDAQVFGEHMFVRTGTGLRSGPLGDN